MRMTLATRKNGDIDLEAAHASSVHQLSVAGFPCAYYGDKFAVALCPATDCPFTTEVPGISIQEYVTLLLDPRLCYATAVG